MKHKIITKLEELEGKTILRTASLIRLTEGIGLIFTDDTYCVFTSRSLYYDESEVELAEEVGDYELKELGFIDQVEYERRVENEKQEYNHKKELQQRREYQELKAKFGS